MISPLYKHGINYALRHTVTTVDPNLPQEYDEYNEPIPQAGTEQHFDFEVQFENPSGNVQERTGYDANEVKLNGFVSKTAWDTLTLPEGVGAGSTFPLTLRGKAGVLSIGAAPDDTHPKVSRKLGAEFSAVWRG